jgi:hypothetical protein
MENYLPTFPALESRAVGRSPYESYQRGWGLEFGKLREEVAKDPDYVRAMERAEGRTLVRADRLMNLFLIIKFFAAKLPLGHIVEFGSYRGGSAFFLATLAEKFLPRATVFGLDTFSGIPSADPRIDAHSAGDFALTDFDELIRAQNQFGLRNLKFVRGLFSDTAPALLSGIGTIALTHIDCDTYESVKFAYETSIRYMVPNGYLVFDDSTTSSCLGATQAVEECVIQRDGRYSEQIFPHHVFRA